MSKILGNPKLLAILILAAVALLISIAGGALGNAFGLGFLGAPVPAIELKAEPFLPGEVFSGWIITNTMVRSMITIYMKGCIIQCLN